MKPAVKQHECNHFKAVPRCFLVCQKSVCNKPLKTWLGAGKSNYKMCWLPSHIYKILCLVLKRVNNNPSFIWYNSCLSDNNQRKKIVHWQHASRRSYQMGFKCSGPWTLHKNMADKEKPPKLVVTDFINVPNQHVTMNCPLRFMKDDCHLLDILNNINTIAIRFLKVQFLLSNFL